MSAVQKPAVPASRLDEKFLQRKTRLIYNLLIWVLAPLGIWWSLKSVSITEVVENVRHLGWGAILGLLSLNIFIFGLLSTRWWMILMAQGYRIPLLSIMSYRLAGFGVTYFTPGPQLGGEPLQVYLLKEREGMQVPPAAVSVTLDKLLELVANFAFLAVGVIVLLASGVLEGSSPWELASIPVLLLALPVGYFFLLRAGHHPISSMLVQIGRQLRRPINRTTWIRDIESQAADFCQRNIQTLILAAILSAGIWGLMVFEFGLMLSFLGIQINLAQVLIALTAARIAFLLPIPGGLGTLEAGQVIAMGLIGVNPAVGIGLSLLIRIRDVLFGAIGLGLGGIYNR